MAQCTKIKANGKQCQAHAFSDGSGLCLFHSSTKKAKLARKIKPVSKEQMIKILQKELKKLDKVEDTVARSAEKRRVIQLICELKGELKTPIEGDNKDNAEKALGKILDKWKKEKINQDSPNS